MCGGDRKPGGGGAGVQPPVPHGQGQVRVADGQGAGQVHGAGAAERVGAGQRSGTMLDGRGQFDRADGGPVLLPGLLGGVQIRFTEVVIAAGRGGEPRTSG